MCKDISGRSRSGPVRGRLGPIERGLVMRRILAALVVGLLACSSAQARGILIPTEKEVPPLAMLNHHVSIAIEDQVAITNIEQTFRNHTDRELEATYVFPVPKGASVRKFVMWINGKETPGEVVEAAKARKIYTSIVQRTLDPGLLEYIGNDLVQVKVFPIPKKGDQKIKISYTSVANSDNGLIEYVYPLKTDGKSLSTLEKFTIKVDIRSQHSIQNIYSPSHAITMTRPNDKQATVGFEKDAAALDRDFQLFYSAGGKDVGLTALAHRPTGGNAGYFMMLVSPRAELSKTQQVPRDIVLVLDTSGSMRGKRMTQARNALKYCLGNLEKHDRFAVINFATTVNKYTEKLLPANADQITEAKKWVDGLEATGGTAIDDALKTALDFRTSDEGRTFTIVFFTDGRPTIGETNTDKIMKNVEAKNTANTRIFTFGVGDDVNASFLDALAEKSRALSTYVREFEDIESKVTSLYAKISNPVLTNLKIEVSANVKLNEVYPPQLPDLFHGSQLVILGRYTGDGKAKVTLTGKVGMETREFVYDTTFADKTAEDKTFVEDLWARRKVGYLLDQIRLNGEKKELVDEVVTLAKRYGITTPYTSYLIVPDGPIPVAGPKKGGMPNVQFNLGNGGFGGMPPKVLQQGSGTKPTSVTAFVKMNQAKAGDGAANRGFWAEKELSKLPAGIAKDDKLLRQLQEARNSYAANKNAKGELKKHNLESVQAGTYGVQLSCDSDRLRNCNQLTQSAQRWIGNRNCLEIGGIWIDETYEAKMKVVEVKAMSNCYFRILERHPSVRKVFQMGNHLVWVTPSNTALVLDQSHGQDEMSDADIDRLFVAAKK
jgi:Ca-activated chloride channel family protein